MFGEKNALAISATPSLSNASRLLRAVRISNTREKTIFARGKEMSNSVECSAQRVTRYQLVSARSDHSSCTSETIANKLAAFILSVLSHNVLQRALDKVLKVCFGYEPTTIMEERLELAPDDGDSIHTFDFEMPSHDSPKLIMKQLKNVFPNNLVALSPLILTALLRISGALRTLAKRAVYS